jgi:hypothetical protein
MPTHAQKQAPRSESLHVQDKRWQTDIIKKRLEESEHSDAEFIAHSVVMKQQKKRLQKKLGA